MLGLSRRVVLVAIMAGAPFIPVAAAWAQSDVPGPNATAVGEAAVNAAAASTATTTEAPIARPRSRRHTLTRRVPRRRRASAAPAVSWASPVGASALSRDLGSILYSHTRSGEWGAMVVSLTRGDTLFEANANAEMQPASTFKMFTAAMALDRFGPDYSFVTGAFRDGTVGSDGVLQGNLYLRGSGDPSLSSRLWKTEEPMDVLAQQIAAAGVKRIHGDIVGDASAFDDQLVPDGWLSRYLGAAYAARVSALSLNENVVWVVVQPDGRTADVRLDPATTAIPLQSSVRVVGGSGGRIRAIRRADGTIAVTGSIGARSGPLRYSLVVDNPPLFATGALRASLAKVGIAVDGTTRLGTTPANAAQIAAIKSPPLAEIVTQMDRESINLFAELLFRSAARAATGQAGSAATGLNSLRTFLAQKVGANPQDVDVTDGSGLSVLDHVTPRAMVKLLAYAHRAPWGSTFHASLPLEGESGTLKRHGRYTPAHGNLHAKTGTTNTVASLGGFVTAKDGEILAFSFIYNGHDRWNAKSTMDQMGATLAEFVR